MLRGTLRKDNNKDAERTLRAYIKHLPLKISKATQQKLFNNANELLKRINNKELANIISDKIKR
jgi:hypothetical protein